MGRKAADREKFLETIAHLVSFLSLTSCVCALAKETEYPRGDASTRGNRVRTEQLESRVRSGGNRVPRKAEYADGKASPCRPRVRSGRRVLRGETGVRLLRKGSTRGSFVEREYLVESAFAREWEYSRGPGCGVCSILSLTCAHVCAWGGSPPTSRLPSSQSGRRRKKGRRLPKQRKAVAGSKEGGCRKKGRRSQEERKVVAKRKEGGRRKQGR